MKSALRGVFLVLTLLDLALAVACTFFGAEAVAAIAPAAYAEPQFLRRCVGVFLFQYVFVQFLPFLDPRRWATALAMTLAVRASFVVTYLAQLVLWGAPFTVLHGLLAVSAAGDAATTIFVLIAAARLDIGLLRGDQAMPGVSAGKFLRLFLLFQAIGQLVIGLGWTFLPKRLCDLTGIAYTVDPFWARATGVFLVNIAVIMYVASRDPAKYVSATLTSAVFSALWPILYWVSIAQGEGNALFRTSVMCASVFDLAASLTTFWLVHRMRAQAAEARPAGPPVTAVTRT